MRELVLKYLNEGLSRRGFLRKMAGAGFSSVAAVSVLESLAPLTINASMASQQPGEKLIRGTGGEILAEQLAEAGIGFMFTSNSSHLRGIYDALVDNKKIRPILSTEEGQTVAIASGYSMASGQPSFVGISVAGAPHASSNMYNAMSARLPVLVATDMVSTEFEDREGIYGGRVLLGAAHSSAKWHWLIDKAELVPDLTRRALKVATTPPGGPVLLSYPDDVLTRPGVQAVVMPQSRFNIQASVRPSAESVTAAARMLLEAKSPALYVGPEGWRSGARAACVEMAELLGIPAMRVLVDSWVDCFPTSHPLFVNAEHSPRNRFPRDVDVLLVLGGFLPPPGRARVIQVTTEAGEVNKAYAVEIAMLADTRLAMEDMLSAVKSAATTARLATTARPRIEAIKVFNLKMAKSLHDVALANWDNKPISWQRLAMELQDLLDPDALIVDELSTEKTKLFSYLRTAEGGRTRIGRSQDQALGWGVGLSIGAKLAAPDRQVVSVIGDGAFMFGGIESLWSMARYEVPVITVVINNRSYNEPRQRILGKMGKQGQTGRDMACYLGNPDVDFAKLGSAFGIKGEVVEEPGKIKDALKRAIQATREGKPYIVDVVTERTGIAAESTWYPKYSLARERSRQV